MTRTMLAGDEKPEKTHMQNIDTARLGGRKSRPAGLYPGPKAMSGDLCSIAYRVACSNPPAMGTARQTSSSTPKNIITL